jgi:hypothetical protein
MRRYLSALLVAGVTMMALSGCAKPPTEEMNVAQAVIDSVAALPDVTTWASGELQAARNAMAGVRQMVTEKNYDGARATLPGVTSTARATVGAAASAKEAARVTADQIIKSAEAAIVEAGEKIPKAPRWGKGAIRDISALKADIEAAKTEVAAAKDAVTAIDYLSAQAKGRAAMSKAQAVTAAIDKALEMRKRK